MADNKIPDTIEITIDEYRELLTIKARAAALRDYMLARNEVPSYCNGDTVFRIMGWELPPVVEELPYGPAPVSQE